MLFNNKKNLLSLYNAINRSDYRNPEELEITTIDQVIYMGILECTAVVLNVNTGHNQEILDQCRLLYEYACFLETVRRYVKESSCTMEEAIDHAVTDCIRKGILAAFLRKHRAEMINVLLTEYDADLHMKATYEEGREDGREEGRQEGLAEGREEGRQEGIRFLISSHQRHDISREETLK